MGKMRRIWTIYPIDEEIGGEVTDLHFQNDGRKIVTLDVEPDIKYLIEKMDEDNANLMYDFTFLELEGKNPLNDRRSTKEANSPMKKGLYKDGKNMDSPKEITLELFMLSFWNKTISGVKVFGETNCRKYLSPNLQLVFDRGKRNLEFSD